MHIIKISLVLKWFLIVIKKNLPPETAKDINEGLLTNIKTFFETRLANILYGPLQPQIMNILIFDRFQT